MSSGWCIQGQISRLLMKEAQNPDFGKNPERLQSVLLLTIYQIMLWDIQKNLTKHV